MIESDIESNNVIDFFSEKEKRQVQNNPVLRAADRLREHLQNHRLVERFLQHGIPLLPADRKEKTMDDDPIGHVYLDGKIYTMPLNGIGFLFTRSVLYIAYFAEDPETPVLPGTRGTIEKINYREARFTVNDVEALWQKMVKQAIEYLKK